MFLSGDIPVLFHYNKCLECLPKTSFVVMLFVMNAFLIIALQKALETKLSELDTTNRNQTSELMSTLKNIKEKLHEKEVF